MLSVGHVSRFFVFENERLTFMSDSDRPASERTDGAISFNGTLLHSFVTALPLAMRRMIKVGAIL
jgi:hypothetical protein